MRRLLAPFLLAFLAVSAPVAALVSSSSASAATVVLPSVQGGFDQAPKISFPSGATPTTLKVSYLHRGGGAAVKRGELLVANYLGQIWHGKVFDSSFSRKQLSPFPIGVGAVIPGWDSGLVGVPVGSRVLLVIPPADGYGVAGDSAAGISGTDTLVFVIDVIAAYGKGYLAQSNPKVLHTSVDGVTIHASGNQQPSVVIPKNTPQPKAVKMTELASGNGPRITAGLVIMQLIQAGWAGKLVASSWTLGSPFGTNIGQIGKPGIFDKLVGMTVGSRILLELPKISSGGPYAVVAEVVSEPHDGAA